MLKGEGCLVERRRWKGQELKRSGTEKGSCWNGRKLERVGPDVYLLIQYVVSLWFSSKVVHQRCSSVERWLQTEFQAPGDFFIGVPVAGRVQHLHQLPVCAKNACSVDTIFS